MAGYSVTPLLKKLGIKPPLTLLAVDAPKEYRAWLGELPSGVRITSQLGKPLQAAHLFVTRRAVLKRHVTAFRNQLEQSGFLWVSWPKKASKVETDITEDVIREIALPLGFVDIKVCAVSEVWSGLKLVIRQSERTRRSATRSKFSRTGKLRRRSRVVGRGLSQIVGYWRIERFDLQPEIDNLSIA